MKNTILKTADLYELLPFKKTKILQLLNSGQFPAVKVGKDWITTYELMNDWIVQNQGNHIYL